MGGISAIKYITYSGLFSKTIDSEFTRKTYRYLKSRDIAGLDYYLKKHRITEGGIDVYCNKCHKIYCSECWETRIRFESWGWYDNTEGICPKNHEKMIDD